MGCAVSGANSETSSEKCIPGSGKSKILMADWRISSEVILVCSSSCHCMKICLTWDRRGSLNSDKQREIQQLRKIQHRIESDPDSVHTDASIDGYHPRAEMGRLLAEVEEVSLFLFVNYTQSTKRSVTRLSRACNDLVFHSLMTFIPFFCRMWS